MTNRSKFFQISWLVVAALVLAACGSDEPTTAANTAAVNTNNPYNGYFQNPNGTGGYAGSNPYSFPIMRPSDNGQSPFSYNTGVQARAGQRVFVSVQGRWGTANVQQRSIFGGMFKIKYNTWNVRCDELDFNGRQGDGTLSNNEGQPAGLRAAIMGSSQNFAVGSSGSFTADRDGMVLIGLNTPEMNNLCHRAGMLNVQVGY